MNRKPVLGIFTATLIALSVIVMSGCEAQQEELQPMDFTYTLTEVEVEETLAAIEEFESFVEEGRNLKIISAEKKAEQQEAYIEQQYDAAQIAYYSNLEDEDAYEDYVFAEDSHMQAEENMEAAYQKLYRSKLPAKLFVFADWTEQKLEKIEGASKEASALEQKQAELVRQFVALDDPESDQWSAEVEKIYQKYVTSAGKLAGLYGYDSYYDYAASEIFMRDYTKNQRDAFRKIVKDQILPFWNEVDKQYGEKKDKLTKKQKDQLEKLKDETCKESNEYFAGYVDSFDGELKTVMENLFVRKAIRYTKDENAHVVAFTDYSEHFDQPFVFLGNEAQDMLTLVHELGHYAAFYHWPDETLPYDTCEVHSQGNEWLLLHYLDGKMDEEVYEAFLLWRLRGGLDTIIMCTIVDEYEETVYSMKQTPEADNFEGILTDVLKNYEGITDYMSVDDIYTYIQYVTIESAVYYLSYATSELAAMTFYSMASEEGYAAAQAVYADLCLNTPSDNGFFDTLMDVGLPDPFEPKTAEKTIEAFRAIVNPAA
ncbi:MAG: hypothetical protein IKJ77_03420 [Firmicutes bacterium]|nr:hypothetical protein [Bacillota bacterium]